MLSLVFDQNLTEKRLAHDVALATLNDKKERSALLTDKRLRLIVCRRDSEEDLWELDDVFVGDRLFIFRCFRKNREWWSDGSFYVSIEPAHGIK